MFSGGLEMATTKISELKDISIKICQAEKEREKVLKKKKQNIQIIGDTFL